MNKPSSKQPNRAAGKPKSARNFPINTCPASRHTQLIGEALVAGKPFPALSDPGEMKDCGESLLATVGALYEARTKLTNPAGCGDWMTPTTYLQRFGDAMERLCGGKRPTDALIIEFLDPNSDGMRLQDFAAEHGPAWAQGIVLIDAVRVLVDDPTEGVEHQMRPQP